MSVRQLAMVVDAERCIDCKACQASCKVANKVPAGYWRNWIKSEDTEAAAKAKRRMRFQPGNCMQCDEPTCVAACPTGATYKDARDGVIKIDRSLCIGCGLCLPACPYGARFRNPELKQADKCDFCAERRAAGLEPACVSTCPTKARAFGDLGDSGSPVSLRLKNGEALRIVNAKSDTKPNIYYRGDPGLKDWPTEARMPTAWQAWKYLAGPAVKAVVGLTALGVGAMFFKQVFMPHDPPVDEGSEKGGGHE